MSFWEICALGVGLAMDAFAIAICKGLNMKKINYIHSTIIALFFGFFQFLMPVLGYFFCSQFESYITNFDHWIVFALLAFIGIKMIVETLTEKQEQTKVYDEKNNSQKLDVKELFVLAIATSIDALAVGISLAFLQVNIWYSGSIIGAITFAISFLGVIIGNFFGEKFKKPAEITGGAILILIGVKVLLEHLGILIL